MSLTKYTIIRCDSIEEMIEETNIMLHDGWTLYSSMTVCKDENNLAFYVRELTKIENPYEKTSS